MKKITLTVCAALFITFSYAQKIEEIQVPAAVKQAFATMHPKVSKVKWDKEKDKYEASFRENNADNSVLFSSAGTLEETELSIAVSRLPKGVMEYVKTHYKGQKVNEAAKITDAKGTVTFEAEVNKTDLLFDANGNFLRQVKG